MCCLLFVVCRLSFDAWCLNCRVWLFDCCVLVWLRVLVCLVVCLVVRVFACVFVSLFVCVRSFVCVCLVC